MFCTRKLFLTISFMYSALMALGESTWCIGNPYVGMEYEDYTSEYYYDKNGNILGAYRQGLVDYYDEGLYYDKNGNILGAYRQGLVDYYDEGLYYDTLDDYSATYRGNQKVSVEGPGVGSPSYFDSSYFVDGVYDSGTNEYSYNANGAMTMDLNRGISSIDYDLLGNIRKITMSGGTVDYVYSADGTRQRTVRSIRRGYTVLKDSTDYCGNLLLKNGAPYMYRFPGGYISFSDGMPSGCHYYIEDYLGNVRMVVDGNNRKEQITHYYPYGGVIGGIAQNAQLQPYKFGGNEFERTCGLDWYDIHARQYDPIVPSWNKIDPLAEKYYHVSPYSYCLNNPVNAIDIKGLFPKFLITQKHTPFYRANFYTLNLPAVRLLSLVSGVSEKYIRNVQIMQRGFGHYYPLYFSNEGGGAITLGNTPDNASINFTPNFFEDDENKYNGHGFGQNFYSWMYLLSHEVTHLKHIEECGNEISYLISFAYDYAKYGHDNTPKEKEADNNSNIFKEFYKFVNKNKGENVLEDLFKSNKTSELKVSIINQWWDEYEKSK